MKIRAAAAAAMLALTLAGCSSPASSSAGSSPASSGSGSSPSASQAQTVLAKEVSLMSLESAMAKLDAVGVTYKVRVQGPEGTILKDPKATAEKGKWKALLLMDDKTGILSQKELKAGDDVKILVMPMAEPTPTPSPTPTTPPDRKVTYVITADGPISNTTFGNMIDGKMSTEQANEVASPFTKEYTFTQRQFESKIKGFSVSAQAGAGTTTISCQINVDEMKGPVKTSTGPYAIVMCTR